MNKCILFSKLGTLLCVNGFFLSIAALIDLKNGLNFAFPSLISLILGIFLHSGVSIYQKKSSCIKLDNEIQRKTAFAIVILGWILIPLLGALPFIFSGISIPNAIFESFSGFTTTGSTIFGDIESLPRGLIFWRTFEHFLGGLGVITLLISVLGSNSPDNARIINAETTGVGNEKFTPKTTDMPKILYGVYFSMTTILFLIFVVFKMNVFDAVCNAFSIAGTGGLFPHNISFAYYDNAALEMIASIFMILFAINISFFWLAFEKQQWKNVLKNEELRFFLGTVAVLTLLLTLANFLGGTYSNPLTSFRFSFFNLTSIISTTGLSTYDFDTWRTFSKYILMFAMFCGGMSGSTAGGVKSSRILIALKTAHREILRGLNPNIVKSVKLNGKTVDEKVISKIMAFFTLYITFTAIFAFILAGIETSFNNEVDVDGCFSAILSSITNTGVGISEIGPSRNYNFFSGFSKIFLSFVMLFGRLEIYPALMIFSKNFWEFRKK